VPIIILFDLGYVACGWVLNANDRKTGAVQALFNTIYSQTLHKKQRAVWQCHHGLSTPNEGTKPRQNRETIMKGLE
jgi:hypothetical protein